MSAHVEHELAEYALGMLPPDLDARVAAHLVECGNCAREARAFENTVSGAFQPMTPVHNLRSRILAAAQGNGRLAAFVDQVSRFFEMSKDKARALLDELDDPACWESGPGVEGLGMIHFTAGGRYVTADAGFVRFPKGIAWPLHRHVGGEKMLIIEGGIREDHNGREWHAGEELINPPGSEHSFHILPDVDCISAVVIEEGGLEMPPGTKLVI